MRERANVSRGLFALATVASVCVASAVEAGSGGLIISEVVDATLPGGLPKYVEITNTSCDDIDLSGYSIGNINNGAATMGFDALVLSGTLASGDSYVISYEGSDAPGSSIFFDVYGFDADNLDQGSFINGDDVLVLFNGAAFAGDPGNGSVTPVTDVYGVVGVDGSGEVWEYTDGYSYRLPAVIVGSATFDAAEWFFGGANSLETGDDVEELALILANTDPGAHAYDTPDCGGNPVLVINEVMQNSSAVGDSDGEWFEVFNPTGADIDMNGWTIQDNDSDSHVIAGSVIVPAGGYAVLCTNADSGVNGGVTCAYEYAGIALANGDDEIVLLDALAVEIDRIEYDNGATFPDPNGASMALRDPALDNNDGLNWCESPNPFGAGDNGTPGAANDCPPPPPTGACCQGGVCTDDLLEAECETPDGGIFQGENSLCADVTCPAPSGGGIFITEFQHGGNLEEWVEFTNLSGAPIDMTGWSYDDDSRTPGVLDLSPFGVVNDGESVVITEATIAAFDADWSLGGTVDIIGEYQNNLGGGGDEINLYDASATLVDRLTYPADAADGVTVWVCEGFVGANDFDNGWVSSTVGDAQGTTTAASGDIGSPGVFVLDACAQTGACCFAGFCKDDVSQEMCEMDGGTFQGEGSLCSGSGGATAATKAGTAGQAVEEAGANSSTDYYGSGNDDDFGEYGVTTFNFDSADFGGAVSTISSASLTLTVNDRSFSDGNTVELFFTTDAIGAGYSFNDTIVNGIDPAQFTYVPVSLGVFNIPEMAGRAGGETDTFTLDLSGVESDLIAAINGGSDFQILVAAVNSADDITYSGVGNTFDPGDPTLEIVAEGMGNPIDCGPAPTVAINEIRIDQPSTDNDEYFELFGDPGQSLDGLWYIVIGDSGSESGILESATPLTGLSVGGSGFFVAAEDTFTLGVADLVTDINFENSDNVTHAIVAGLMASTGDDLDLDNDCSLDVTPWAGVVDLIALIEEDNPPVDTECHYGGETVGPDGTFVPGHVARCPDGNGKWRILSFDPADGDDTPGAANLCVVATGACCFTTGVCEVLTEDECTAGAGSYLGDDEACEGDADADNVDGRCGDECPDDPNKTEPGVCGCGTPDDDSDNDGVLDCNDGCPFDPNKTEPGICGCGFADIDTDNDGFLDCEEICDMDPNKQDPGVCGCGTPDVDTDGDGVLDCNDQCPGEDDTVDANGNSIPDCLEQPESVPTVSTWGLIALALLLLSAAKVATTRRTFA